MKKLLTLITFLCFTFVVSAQEGDVAKVGDKLPNFTLNSEKFGKIQSSELNGKVVLISLFATWCGPCQKELAAFENTLFPKYKNNENFKLVVIGREHTDAEIEKYLARKKFTFPIYPDANKEITPLFATKFIPRCYLVNKSGEIVYASQGYSGDDFGILMMKIDELLRK